jgi:NitT/TauT family transport system ATP-binding protein
MNVSSNGNDNLMVCLTDVRKTFRAPDRTERVVLEGVNFKLAEGEIVALLGKSGSGKSTLLRIIAGLSPATGGEALYRGHTIDGPVHGLAMVFQTFALFPWLTVQQNVELGLEATGVAKDEREKRALEAIDTIGLGGFESAYPRELSGGMRQRVGFARALVMRPDVMVMDEPFSALDVLTAETLRDDLLELWQDRALPLKSVLIVSHNIEEAVYMADRVLVFSSDPGRVKAEIRVPLARPRDRDDPAFKQIVDEIYGLMTQHPPKTSAGEVLPLAYRLPEATPHKLTGMLETLSTDPFDGHADIPHLAESLEAPDEILLQMLEAARLLNFVKVESGDVTLLQAGQNFAAGDLDQRKAIFSEHLLKYITLASHICKVLRERPGHRAPKGRFLQELEDYLSDEEADRVLDQVINWGRFAEIFEYDDNSGVLSLPEPEEPAAPNYEGDGQSDINTAPPRDQAAQ